MMRGTHGYNDPLTALHTQPNSLSGGGVVKLNSLVYGPLLIVTAAILYW